MLTSSEVTYKLAGNIKHMGLPLTGVLVRLLKVEPGASAYTGQLVNEYKTGPSGDFFFSVSAGNYGLIVIPDPNTCFVPRIFEGVSVTANTVINIALVTGVILKGKVSLPPSIDSFGIQNIQVVALGIDETEARQSTSLDKNGRYSMVLPKGHYMLAAASLLPESRSQLKPVSFISTHVETVDLSRDTDVAIDLSSLSHFKGRLQDGNGGTVGASVVTVKPTKNQSNHLIYQFDSQAHCISGPSGEFDLWLDAAEYDFVIEPPEFAPLAETKEEAVYLAEGSTKTFVLNKGYRLSGKVEFEGNAVPNCHVQVENSETRSTLTVYTDGQGYFRLSVPEGTHEISVNPQERGSGKLPAPAQKTITVDRDLEIPFSLRAGVSVKGFVRDKQGEPRPDVRIALTPDIGLNRQSVYGVTDNDGSYFMVVEPGKYSVCLNNDRDKIEPLFVPNGGLDNDFVCQGACVVRLKVVSEDEEPVAGCHISWGPYGHNEGQLGLFAVEESSLSKGAAISDHNGICQMTLAEGVYTFRFLPPSDSSCDERTIRQLSISGDMKRKVKLTFKSS